MFGADAVEDHAGDVHVRVERAVPVDDRRDRAGHRGGVYHQHDRRAEQFGDMSGRCQLAPARGAVEQPHHAFDYGDVGAFSPVPGERSDQLRTTQEGIKVPSRPT